MKVLVVDLDDTVYLERDYVRSGFESVGRFVEEQHGAAGFGARCQALFEGGHRNSTFNVVLAELGLDAALAPALVEHYRSHRPAIELLPDVRPALELVRERGVGLAILTDGAPASQRAKVAALGIEALVDAVVVTDELGGPRFRKPHPAGFAAVLAAFPGVSPADVTYLGDNPGKDREGVEAAGWSFVRIRRTGGLHAELDDDGTCTTHADLVAAVEALR